MTVASAVQHDSGVVRTSCSNQSAGAACPHDTTISRQVGRSVTMHACMPHGISAPGGLFTAAAPAPALTLVVQHKAVGQDLLVGRVAVGCHRGEQRRLEPAAVLVRALHDTGRVEAAPTSQGWTTGHTGVQSRRALQAAL